MNDDFSQAREIILKAREALLRKDKATARVLGEQATLLAPDFEDAWLILAASELDPLDALAYARKALEIQPQSPRARRAVEWAEQKMNQAGGGKERVGLIQAEASRDIPIIRESKNIEVASEPKPRRRLILYGGAFGLLACVMLLFAAWSTAPVFASILDRAPAPTQENLWAHADIPKPSGPQSDSNPGAPVAQAPVTATPIVVPTVSIPEPTFTPTFIPIDAPTLTPAATETPAALAMDVLADTPTSEYIPPTAAPTNEYPTSVPPPVVASGGSTGGTRWIDVDLTNQMVYAYEGDTAVNSFLVSTGTWLTPTITGKYKIYVKYRAADMSGPGYYLADVPYVMYFYKGYGLHGTYWHNNFGTPMSHGCINLRTTDAEWLFGWASIGTVVNVHY